MFTITMTVRDSADRFSVTVRVSDWLPDPELGATSAHCASDRAVHEQPEPALIVNVVRVSLLLTDEGRPDTDDTHPAEPLVGALPPLGALGPVSELPPHAATMRAAVNGRRAS